jgi:EAL and modified HD-GYP domain-containing signal transduction protein
VASVSPSPVAAVSPAASPHPEVAVVRQPIADARHGVVGYELLFDSARQSGDPAQDARATSALIADAFGDIGLERLAGRHPAWLSIARNFLVEVGPPPVRPDRAVLQIVAYPAREDLLALLQKLSRGGFSIALTDFDGDVDLGPLLDICSIVKVNVSGKDDTELARAVAAPRAAGSLLVAKGVGSLDEFERCREYGFSYFQGDFFCKPRELRYRGVSAGSVGSLQTLAKLSGTDAGFEELEEIITSDVGLSLKLLRYVNSAFFSLPRTIGSVREALAMLGVRMVRRWALVVAMSESSHTPDELVAVALQRARMCERLGALGSPQDREVLFTIGLFSVADALLGAPMDEVLATLPFSLEIEAALLHHEGPKGALLAAVLEYERGAFPALEAAAHVSLAAVYREALEYADDATSVVRSVRESGA